MPGRADPAGQPKRRERGRGQAGAGPAPLVVGVRGRPRAQRAADEHRGHVDRGDARPGRGQQFVDHALPEQVGRLHRGVHDQGAEDKRGEGQPVRQVRAAEADQRVRGEQRPLDDAGERPAEPGPRVDVLAAERGDQGAGRPREREQADLQLVKAVRRAAEQERDRGPERGERPEAARADQAPPAQHRLDPDEAEGLPQLPAVTRVDLRRQVGHHLVEDDGRGDHADGGERVDAAPAGQLGDDARERTGQQDAREQPGQHGADRPGALRRSRERRGERDQHLDDDRRDPDDQGERAERREAGGGRAGADGHRVDAEQDGEQRSPPGDVRGGDEEQQADAVAELGEGDEQGRARLADPQAVGDGRQ